MPYVLPPLPYPYDALAPTIDELTLRLHHGRHHAAHVTNLNEALAGTGWADQPVDTLLADLGALPEPLRATVRDNGGGHANHSLLWESMAPDGGGDPKGALRDAVDGAFGSVTGLRDRLSAAGSGHVGSGWVWLVLDGDGLAVTSTANQDSPLMAGQTPLLGIDLWEHAYYLKHQHRRADYLEGFWNVIRWDSVTERYAEAAG